MPAAKAYAAQSATTPLAPWSLQRRDPGPRDVSITVTHCGVCHSDLHTARNEWRGTVYPVVPGHEIIGTVASVGAQVRGFKPGDTVGVGCMVDSCRACAACKEGLEQYCDGPLTFTYNSPDAASGGMTYGGYSTAVTVDQSFVLRIAPSLNRAAAAPLLCAGITTWSPLRHWGVGPGQRVGVVGLGGLGHMGVKFAHAMGARTVLFTTSASKAEDARRLGADEVVLSRDADAMAKQANSFDFILNTVAASHDLDPYVNALKRDGTLCLVGAPEHPHAPPGVFPLIFRRRRIAGSLIGGVRETQEMLDFCAAHSLACDVETIPMHAINDAYERMLRGDVKYRFVIDLASLHA